MRKSSFQTFGEPGLHLGLRALGSVCLSVVALAALAADDSPTAPTFDHPGKKVVLSVQGTGVQVYECKSDDSGHLAWKFREPLAILTSQGQTVGRHFAGPTWQLEDGSQVVGKVIAHKAGATDHDIEMLQLDVVSHSGAGVLTGVTSVERLDTRGGVFAGACQQPGALHGQPYSAEYLFLGQ